MKIKSVYPRPKRFRGAGLLFAFIFAVAFIKLIGLAQRCGFGSSRYQSIFPSSFSLTTTPYQPNRQHDHLSKHASEWTGYSIKPIAYVFPQFHAIPENDRFWGANFTEWVNVKKVKENAYGLETLQPAKEIGYYNLLDYNVRERYAKLVKDSGLYGLAYHHYWFGYPVMDKPLQAMLADGQPDVPFMLSWANEPWTVRWDGVSSSDGSGTLLAQDYGNSTEWRRHFDWMAPLFRHPNYIRCGATGKAQLVVYSSSLMGDVGKRMFAKWRRWAAEDASIGGLDVIETVWAGDWPIDRGPTDATAEFAPHSGGDFDMTAWTRNGRVGAVHHRGVLVSWDNTPRHVDDGNAHSTVWVHPELWKQSLIGMMRHIKLDPNPRGEENFLFINALNEWGEGNVLEPSEQWGSSFSQALRAAVDHADSALPWADDLIRQGEELEPEVMDPASQVDVCVVIRDPTGSPPWADVWQLSHTLWSLQAQHNPRWRAVVVPVDEAAVEGADMRGMEAQVMDTYDPRIKAVNLPEELRTSKTKREVGEGDGYFDDEYYYYDGGSDDEEGRREDGRANRVTADDITDWVVGNIDTLSPACGRATYLLVTNATMTYEPHVFDVASRKRTDIIGLNIVSRRTMEWQDQREGNMTWDRRCARYATGSGAGADRMKSLCQPMVPRHHQDDDDREDGAGAPALPLLDLSGVLLSLARWRKEGHRFREAAGRLGDSAGVLAELEGRRRKPWAWAAPTWPQCDVMHASTYPACLGTGQLWFDGPDKGGFTSGCYSGSTMQWMFGEDAIPTHWDYKRFKQEDPYCVRLSEQRYEDALAGKVMASSAEGYSTNEGESRGEGGEEVEGIDAFDTAWRI